MLQSAVWIEVVLTMPTAEGWVVCLQLREQLHHQARELGGDGPGRVCHRVWFEGPVKSFLIRVGWRGGGPAPGARVGGVGRRSVGVIVGSEGLAASTGASVAIDVIVTAVQGEVGVTTGGSARPEGRP